MSGRLDLMLGARAQEVMRGCDALRAFCREQAVPEAVSHDLVLAFEEIGSNVVRHGYRSSPEGRLSLTVDRNGDTIRLEVRDDAGPFDPSSAAVGALEARPEGATGGLGLVLVRALVDSVEYSRDGGQNRLVLTRRIDAGRAGSKA